MIQLPPLATHGAVRKRTELKTRMAGEDRSWPGRTPRPVAGIEIGGPDDERWCRKSFFEPAGHSRDSTGGLEFGGMPYVRGAEFQEMGGPGSSSSRRGAGRERSAAVVEHRRILGQACRDGRLAARPARQPRGGACRA